MATKGKQTESQATGTSKKKRRRHTPHTYQTARELTGVFASGTGTQACNDVSRALLEWVTYLMKSAPSASSLAGALYLAIANAWDENRTHLYGKDDLNDLRDRENVRLHTGLLDALRVAKGEPTYGEQFGAHFADMQRRRDEAHKFALKAYEAALESYAKSATGGTSRQQQLSAAPRKTDAFVGEECRDHYARFGLLAGDKVELEEVSDPRSGEVLLLRYKNQWEVGRFIGYQEDEGKRWIVVDQLEGEYWFSLSSTVVYRISAVIRRFIPEEAKGDESKADKARRIAELRRRLDRLTDITDETQRFRIEREIYDLEHAVDEDEWPEGLAM